MSRGFAEEETHNVCKVCDYAIKNENCPGCGFSFESFSIKEHDAAIRRQTIEEQSYQRGKRDAIDKLMKYAFDLMCGYDENGMIGKYCRGIGCSATNCEYKYLENYAEDIKKEQMKGDRLNCGENSDCDECEYFGRPSDAPETVEKDCMWEMVREENEPVEPPCMRREEGRGEE